MFIDSNEDSITENKNYIIQFGETDNNIKLQGKWQSNYYIQPALGSVLNLIVTKEIIFSINVPTSSISKTEGFSAVSITGITEDNITIISNIRGSGTIQLSSNNHIVINQSKIQENENLVIDPVNNTDITINQVSLFGTSSINGGLSSNLLTLNQLTCEQSSNIKLTNLKINSELILDRNASVNFESVDVSICNITISYSLEDSTSSFISGEIGNAPQLFYLHYPKDKYPEELSNKEIILVKSENFSTCDEWRQIFSSEISQYDTSLCRKEDEYKILSATKSNDFSENGKGLESGEIAGIVIGVIIVVVAIIVVIIFIIRRKNRQNSQSFSSSDISSD